MKSLSYFKSKRMISALLLTLILISLKNNSKIKPNQNVQKLVIKPKYIEIMVTENHLINWDIAFQSNLTFTMTAIIQSDY